MGNENDEGPNSRLSGGGRNPEVFAGKEGDWLARFLDSGFRRNGGGIDLGGNDGGCEGRIWGMKMTKGLTPVFPAKAGIQRFLWEGRRLVGKRFWIPAFAGKTGGDSHGASPSFPPARGRWRFQRLTQVRRQVVPACAGTMGVAMGDASRLWRFAGFGRRKLS